MKGACYLTDRGVWINLIRGGEEQSTGVTEAPVESSKLINTVVVHWGYMYVCVRVCVCVCVTRLLKCIKSIKATQTTTNPPYRHPHFHI